MQKYYDGEASHYDKNTSLNSVKRENLSLDLVLARPLSAWHYVPIRSSPTLLNLIIRQLRIKNSTILTYHSHFLFTGFLLST